MEYIDKKGKVHECIKKGDIEEACIKEGYERYAQSIGTPFTKKPLLLKVGNLAKKEGAQQILKGIFDTTGLDKYTTKFIQELKEPKGVKDRPKITGMVSTTEYCKAWHRVRKKTVASPFGPTFSELIAGTYNNEVAEINTAIESIPMQAGYSPEQWERGVNSSRDVESMDSYGSRPDSQGRKDLQETRNVDRQA